MGKHRAMTQNLRARPDVSQRVRRSNVHAASYTFRLADKPAIGRPASGLATKAHFLYLTRNSADRGHQNAVPSDLDSWCNDLSTTIRPRPFAPGEHSRHVAHSRGLTK